MKGGVLRAALRDSDDPVLRVGVGGRNQVHEFRDPDHDLLWAAGIWKESQELGPCYTMVATAALWLMSPIHGRMPALLRPEAIVEWLAGTGRWDFQPFGGSLVVTP